MSTKTGKLILLGPVLALALAISGGAWAQGGGAKAHGGAQAQHKSRAAERQMEMHRIEAAQRMLNQHGAKLKVDGHLGPTTMAALKKFQGDNGLKATGHLDKMTMEKLGIK